MDYTDAEPYWDSRDAVLSEGITYVAETQTLLWVDIYRAEVHKLEDVDDLGTHEVFYARGAGSVGAVFPIYSANSSRFCSGRSSGTPSGTPSGGLTRTQSANGCSRHCSSSSASIEEFFFAAKKGVARGSFRTGQWEYVALYESSGLDAARLARLRSNDGCVHGEHVYVGLIDDFDQPGPVSDDGCVVRVSLRNYDVEVVWPHIRIPNGLHWMADGDMLLTDSLQGCLWQVDARAGVPSGARRFIDVRPHCGDLQDMPEPDGSCTDAARALLFVAVWSAARVQVYSLADGSFVKDISLPPETPRVSSCVLVGSDLWVTTGSEWLGTQWAGTRPSRGGCIYRLRGVMPEGEPEFSSNKVVTVVQGH